MDYVIARQFIKTGDVIGCEGKSFIQLMIRKATGQSFNHIAMFVWIETGLYVFDSRVIDIAKNVKPSERGEIEIVDIQNWYLKKDELEVSIVDGEWIDAGTFDSYLKAQLLAKKKLHKKLVI